MFNYYLFYLFLFPMFRFDSCQTYKHCTKHCEDHCLYEANQTFQAHHKYAHYHTKHRHSEEYHNRFTRDKANYPCYSQSYRMFCQHIGQQSAQQSKCLSK